MTSEGFEYEFKWFKDDFDTNPENRGRVFSNRSPLEELRASWEPELRFDPPLSVSASPSRIGIILTGEWVPASGTHNVIIGIVRHIVGTIKGTVLGFLGGPQGFAHGHYVSLNPESVCAYLNQGGCDLLGFGSLRAIDATDFLEIQSLALKYQLTSIIFVGGPKELGHVVQIIEHGNNNFPNVISVLQSPNSTVHAIHPTLGFDSTSRALAEYIGNIDQTGVHFVRSGSTSTTLAVALLVGPAYAVLAEEGIEIFTLVNLISEIISSRIEKKFKKTLVLVSDKFFAFLPGFAELQLECREWYQKEPTFVLADLVARLSAPSRALLETFSPSDQARLVRAYDANGYPTMPESEPQEYLSHLISVALNLVAIKTHSLEIRCPFPTDADCRLGLALGFAAAELCRRAEDGCCRADAHDCLTEVQIDASHTVKWKGVPLTKYLTKSVAPNASVSAPLAVQFGGANQELINLARQRVQRESRVPQIAIRFEEGKIEDDEIYMQYSLVRERDKFAPVSRQPGPVQFDFGYHSISPLQSQRLEYIPRLGDCSQFRESEWTPRRSSRDLLRLVFPYTNAISNVVSVEAPKIFSKNRVGIVFLGRPAPGCHNVVWGLSQVATVVGIRQGSLGLVRNLSCENLDISPYRNQAGIALLGRSDTVLKSREDLVACANTCRALRLDGLVVVGGIGTHADTALLSEVLVAQGVPTRIVGVPASVRNDIPLVEQSLGHDTACKVVASLVGSLATLAASAKRQWCFVRVAGGSHVLAETALQTHANLVLLAEEISARRMSLVDIVKVVADLISERALAGLDFGVILLSDESIQISSLQSHVSQELQRRKIFSSSGSGSFVCSSFSIGDARASMPSNFDCDLGLTMGRVAGNLIAAGKSGLMVNVKNLHATNWRPEGIPLTSFLTVDNPGGRHHCRVSIEEKEVDVNFGANLPLPKERRFRAPGPIQFSGPLADARLTPKRGPATSNLPHLLSRLMFSAATASDESVRKVIQSGLDLALSVGQKTAKTVTLASGPASPGSLRGGTHCRIVQLEPYQT